MSKKRNLSLSKGFTLIEALAVIAIIGLLSAFAVPSYLDYLTKTRVSEMFMLARTAQLGVADAIYSGIVKEKIHSEEAGVTWVENQHERIESITVESGRVVMKGKSKKMGITKADAGDLIIVHLTPIDTNGMITWQCNYINADHKKFLPNYCISGGVDGA